MFPFASKHIVDAPEALSNAARLLSRHSYWHGYYVGVATVAIPLFCYLFLKASFESGEHDEQNR